MRLGPDAPVRDQLLVLIDREGNTVKTLHADRQFGRVQHDGVWYTGARARRTDLSDMVYFEDLDGLLANVAAGRTRFDYGEEQ